MSQRLNISSESPPEAVSAYVETMANLAGVDSTRALYIARCESGFHPLEETGDHGTSVGLFQIHLPAHEDISKSMARSLIYSTAWSLNQMQENHWGIWSCDPGR